MDLACPMSRKAPMMPATENTMRSMKISFDSKLKRTDPVVRHCEKAGKY
ncbi:hypothetical protein SpAn4DRAFT_2287 [Sporomusa ovata]|uniref:Uncharacterized protein n=1 Tax=Sporomusa ovata TaxID=2378 RepID=A0A0U1L0H9_9FIRM|nr:hypothetical protein SpAn4DRAFT_2287 [Sporomusa ovata]